MRPFQIGLIGFFAFAAVAGLIFVTMYTSEFGTGNPYGQSVVIWGTLDSLVFQAALTNIQNENNYFHVVKYEQKDPRTFDAELTNAIAEGRSPDIVVLPHDLIVKHRAKLLLITYETYKERLFRDTFIDGAEIYLTREGIYGIPFAVDPMVMYWNRDVLSSSGVAAPPATWEELTSVTVPRVTKANAGFDITQSAVAFGEYDNIRHAKKILSTLLLQAGSTIVHSGAQGYAVTLNASHESSLPPGDATLTFYTQFALPTHSYYSWNRSLREDHLQFLAGALGLYFGPGSEYQDIAKENPNLNFDVARVPQGASATIKRDFGTFYAFAIPKGSQNTRGAFGALQELTRVEVSAYLARGISMAPVHRATLALGTNDPYVQVLYDMALISRAWLDPDPVASEAVFKQMIEDVTSGRMRIHQAVTDAIRRLEFLF